MLYLNRIDPSATSTMAQMIDSAMTTVRAVGRGEAPSTLRIYRPQPTVAFGRRDELSPRFPQAQAVAEAHGFEPLVRTVGGHAAAYHSGCLIVDHFQKASDAVSGNHERYGIFGAMFAEALTDLGITAGVGELPGEYCPGEYSVWGQLPGGQRVKLIGTAQRVVAGAWWFSSGIVVTGADSLRQVTADVYRALDLPLDPTTVGAAADIEPLITVDDIEDAVIEAYESEGF
ncbi:lipoate--protein ligase family protein [Rothia nasisuis]|uniref:lipoate--protein ligase family protein n=1 Tax=Rothia nasisuis TaxID=2109647 RepID=UPI001F2A23E9|nr:lipoate--protein ligase family protein [Rothia nasisuis]